MILLLVLVWRVISVGTGGNLFMLSCFNEEIRTIYDSNRDCYSLYIPVVEDPSKRIVSYVSGGNILIDDQPIQEGLSWPAEIESGKHDLQINGRHSVLHVSYLSDIPKVFIKTNSTTMEKVYSDKNHQEKMQLTVIDGTSRLTMKGTISGRGKTTWEKEKKPFNLKLDKNVSIFGWGSSAGYVLLANARDPSDIRNKIVYDAGKRLGFAWTPDCVFVDLYLNGEYNGLYLLAEKIEAADNKVNIKPEDGFLVDTDYPGRRNELDYPFVLKNGQTFEIKYPKTGDKKHLIQQKMQKVDEMITNRDSNVFKYIDLDSWVKKYLIEEVFENSDGGIASQYYYSHDLNDGMVFAGPIWDYDLTMGQYQHPNIRNPETLIICEHSQGLSDRYWYEDLYQNKVFFDRVTSIYAQKMHPILDYMLDTMIPSYVQTIHLSASADDWMWNREENPFENEIQYICSYLKKREAFLDSVWIHRDPYYQVKMETGFRCLYDLYLTVRTGERLPDPKELENIYQLDFSDFEYWIDVDTGKPFDASQPLTSDMNLMAVFTEDIAAEAVEETTEETGQQSLSNRIRQHKKDLFILGICTIFGIALVAFIVTDRRRQHGR